MLLIESTQGLDQQQTQVVENIYKHFLPLIEASLSPDQIKQLFANIEQSATAGGKNRTLLGKGKDVAVKANEIINNVGKWLQDTKPVQNFDAKFEKLKNDINTKFPDSKLLDGISNLAIWVKDNPGKTAAVIGVLTAIASLAAGPVGGAIAGQVLKGSVELLKGEKLSTAIGKGAKAAAFGWLTGKAVEFIGSALSAPVESAAKEMGQGIVKASYKSTIDEIGGEFGNRFGTFATGELYGKAQDVADIKEVWQAGVDAWKSGDYLRSDSMFKSAAKMAADLSDPEYVKSVASTVDTAKAMMASAKEMQKFFGTMADVAQGAATAATGNEPAKKESVIKNGKKLSEGQVYMLFNRVDLAQDYLSEAGFMDTIKGAAGKLGQKLATKGKNLTTKITADKLNTAWQKAGSPTDSDDLYNFLQQQGVSPEVIAPVYDTMKLTVPGGEEEPAADQGQKLEPAKDEPAQAKPDTIGLQTQEPAQGAKPAADATQQTPQQQATGGAKAAQDEPAAQSTKVDVVKLAQEIKDIDPDITGVVKKMLDDDAASLKQAKKQQAKPAASQPQQTQAA